VDFVTWLAVYYSRMCSVMGRNVQYEGISRAGMIRELVMVRDGSLCMSTDDFTHDVLALIQHLCID